MIFEAKENMYNKYDYDSSSEQMTNKLLCTFTTLGDVDDLVNHLFSTYDIMYDKVFVLNILEENELVCTYNVDQGNVESMPDNTILVHRKKETNSLYSLNALNELIKKLNGGVENVNFPIPWSNYRNCILLTRQGELKQLKTSIKKIVDFSK
jgi:hypothetical protein